MAIDTDNIINSATLKIRAMIASGITDPISASRTSKSRFVMTSKPDRPVEYPMIRVGTKINRENKTGMKSNMMSGNLTSEINIYAKNSKQLDGLAGSAMHYFRTQQHTTDGTINNGLYDFTVLNAFPIESDIILGDKTSKEARDRFIVEINYNYIAV